VSALCVHWILVWILYTSLELQMQIDAEQFGEEGKRVLDHHTIMCNMINCLSIPGQSYKRRVLRADTLPLGFCLRILNRSGAVNDALSSVVHT
jgi:hypothetical protein